MKTSRESKAEYNAEPDPQEQEIHDHQNPRKYFAMIPNIVDDSDLDPYERTLYLHYVRVGTCNESTRTTAEKCHMSMGQVSDARRSLEQKEWIAIGRSRYGTCEIYILDRWAENMTTYSPDERRSPPEQSVHTVNRAFTTRTQRSPGETKKNHNKEPLQQPQQQAAVAVARAKPEEQKDEAFGLAVKLYQQDIGIINPRAAEILRDELDGVDPAWIQPAFDKMIRAGTKRPDYLYAIWRNWKLNGMDAPKGNGHSPPQEFRHEDWVRTQARAGENIEQTFARLKQESVIPKDTQLRRRQT